MGRGWHQPPPDRLQLPSQPTDLFAGGGGCFDRRGLCYLAFQPSAASNDPWLLFPASPTPIQRVSGSTGTLLTALDTAAILPNSTFTALSVDAAGNVYLAAAYPPYAFQFYAAGDGYEYSPSLIEYISIAKVSPSGALLFVVNVTNPGGGSYINGLAVTASGGDIYASTSGALFRLSGSDGAQLDFLEVATNGTVTAGSGGFSAIAISPPASFDNVVADYSTSPFALQSVVLTNSTAVPITPLLTAASPTDGVVYVLGQNSTIQALTPDDTDLGVFGSFPLDATNQIAPVCCCRRSSTRCTRCTCTRTVSSPSTS